MPIWKKIKGFEKQYAVSNTGQIKSLKTGKLRKQRPHYKSGYAMVDLKSPGNNKTVNVHRVVAKHHLKNYKENLQVNHEKGNKMDSNAKRLSMMTASENSKHSRQTGLYGRYTVNKHVRKKKNGASVVKRHSRNKKKTQ